MLPVLQGCQKECLNRKLQGSSSRHESHSLADAKMFTRMTRRPCKSSKDWIATQRDVVIAARLACRIG